MALNRPTGGSTFLKAGDHLNDLALLVEPKRVEDNVKNSYQGAVTYRDIATADISVFATSEDVQNKKPSKILKGVKIDKKALVRECRDQLGGQFVAVIRKVPMGAGSGYVFNGREDDVPANVFDAVSAYVEARDAEVQANLDAAPDFD